MKRFVKAGVLLVFCLFISYGKVMAQDDPPCDGTDPFEENCPIDTNLVALVAGGLGLGWFAIRKQVA
ncbi:MAG: hypothetical protein ACOH2A_15840 [Sphingobacteriaceae bacterium]